MTLSTIKKKEKAFLVGVTFNSREDVSYSLEELTNLSGTANLDVVGTDWQYVREINPATILGTGKLEEIKEKVQILCADVVIVDYSLTGSQLRNIGDALGVRVIDRTLLILDIFAGRANSAEGKLQVKLALNRYYLPRLSSISGTSGRFGSGGVGMRGPGETKLELDKRAIARDIESLEKEIEKIKERRLINRNMRTKSGKKKIAIIGYTNAGKSTLLNLMTKENIYADDKLFATLDTTTRALWLDVGKEVVLTDTVGFISKLPHNLVDAFSATLEEAADADLLLHIVDVVSPHYKEQMQVVFEVVKDIGASHIPMIIAYNKCDMLGGPFEIKNNEILVSAAKNINIDKLKAKFIEILF